MKGQYHARKKNHRDNPLAVLGSTWPNPRLALGLTQARNAIADFPFTPLFQDGHALEPLQDVALAQGSMPLLNSDAET